MLKFLRHGYGQFGDERPIGPSVWPHFDLLWMHEGRIRLTIMDQSARMLEGGSGVLIYPHTPFVGQPLAPDNRASVQHFDLRARDPSVLPAPLRRLVGKTRGARFLTTADRLATDRDIDRAIVWAAQPAGAMLNALRVAQLTLILGQLFMHTSTARSTTPRAWRMQSRLREWMMQRLDQSVNLNDMATAMDMSASHFRAEFRKYIGCAPYRYLLKLRLDEAARLLRETRTPIKLIARRTGFGELANFYRAFRATIGDTPAKYRRDHEALG